MDETESQIGKSSPEINGGFRLICWTQLGLEFTIPSLIPSSSRRQLTAL